MSNGTTSHPTYPCGPLLLTTLERNKKEKEKSETPEALKILNPKSWKPYCRRAPFLYSCVLQGSLIY
jgi:hypothetical protein